MPALLAKESTCKSHPFMQSEPPSLATPDPTKHLSQHTLFSPPFLYLHINHIFARAILTPHIARTSFTPTAAFQHPIVNVKPAPRSLDHIKQVYAVYKVLLSDIKINFDRAYLSFFLPSLSSPNPPLATLSHKSNPILPHTHTYKPKPSKQSKPPPY